MSEFICLPVWLAVSGSLDIFTCLCRLVSRWCPALQMSLLPSCVSQSGWRCPALWTSSLVSVDWFPGGVRLSRCLSYPHVSPSLAGGVWLAVSGSLDVFTCLCRLVSRWCPALQMSLLPSCVSQSGWRCLAGGVRLFGRLHLSL